MHECSQVLLLLERRTKGCLACCYHSFLQVLSAENILFRQEGMVDKSQVKLLNLIGHVRNKTRQLRISLLRYSGNSICQTPGLLLTQRIEQ